MMTTAPPEGFRLIGSLGQGTSAQVFLGEELALSRQVPLKRLDVSDSQVDRTAWAYHEGRLLAQVQNRHIARLFDVILTEDAVWLVLEYVPCPSLQTLLDSGGRLKVWHALHWSAQLADALVALGRRSVVHLDVKRANAVIEPHGPCRLVDLWISRELRGPATDLVSIGTPAFMAPEVAAGVQTPGPAADVYSLVLVTYQMLSQQHPFQSAVGDSRAMMNAQLWHEPTPVRRLRPEVSRSIQRLLKSALEKNPAGRPTATESRSRVFKELR